MNLKTIVLSLGLVTMMLPASAMAQNTTERPGGLFGHNDQSGTSFLYRAEDEEFDLFVDVDIQTFQDPVPLGSGIVILLGASLGYIALKKKEDKQ